MLFKGTFSSQRIFPPNLAVFSHNITSCPFSAAVSAALFRRCPADNKTFCFLTDGICLEKFRSRTFRDSARNKSHRALLGFEKHEKHRIQ
jgi:hypothetical protein